MKIAIFFLTFLLISAIFLTACGTSEQEQPTPTPNVETPATPEPPQSAADDDLVAEDEVDIGELV